MINCHPSGRKSSLLHAKYWLCELFEQHIKTDERQSSKGNQLKWENQNVWYKADYAGYEGLAEYIVSALLGYSTLASEGNDTFPYRPEALRYCVYACPH